MLIFSQMTQLLNVIEDYIRQKFGNEAYERVDGSVASYYRQQRIARFNQPGSERFIFLLSTRACVLGINLATAVSVIIYDSDWNPHNDTQAMSRAHRIGQKNRLMVYRFYCKNTVEERIHLLARKKMALDSIFKQDKKDSKENSRVMEDIIRWGTEDMFSGREKEDENDGKEIDSRVIREQEDDPATRIDD